MVYNEEMVYLKKNRAELMEEMKSIMEETISAVEEGNKIANMIHDMRNRITSGTLTDKELDDYASLVPVLILKYQTMEKEKEARGKRFAEISMQVMYIDELIK